MKTIVSPLLFLALFFSILMPNVAEADEGNMCYIYVETSEDAENGIPKDRLAWVDSVFQRFGVKNYFLSFPQAKTESLKNIYEIHAEGNIGITAGENSEFGNYKPNVFHCKVKLNLGKVKQEEALYIETPNYYDFGSERERENYLDDNYARVFSEIEAIVNINV